MSQQKHASTPGGRTKIQREAGDAAAILARQMTLFQHLSEHCFENWKAKAGRNDYDQGTGFFQAGIHLTDSMAKLGTALARLHGQAQHIKVERVAPAEMIAPASAASDDANALNSENNSTNPIPEGGEGVCDGT